MTGAAELHDREVQVWIFCPRKEAPDGMSGLVGALLAACWRRETMGVGDALRTNSHCPFLL